MFTIVYDCIQCKFKTPKKFIPGLVLDFSKTVLFFAGFILLFQKFNEDVHDVCDNSYLGIYLSCAIVNAFIEITNAQYFSGYVDAKNIDMDKFPVYYVDLEYQEKLKQASKTPTNKMSAGTNTNFPIFKFCTSIAMTCWGFNELYNNECIVEDYDNSVIYGLSLFATIIYLLNSLRWLVGIYVLWPTVFSYKFYVIN